MNAPRPRIALVWAQAPDGGIGLGGELLLQHPDDMARFFAETVGRPVVMGRRTWDSIPAANRPLRLRRNVVLSRDAALRFEGAEAAPSLGAALASLRDEPLVSVIGGAQVYAEAMPLADELVVTVLLDAPVGAADAFAPEIDPSEWREAVRYGPALPSEQHGRCLFLRYQRITASGEESTT